MFDLAAVINVVAVVIMAFIVAVPVLFVVFLVLSPFIYLWIKIWPPKPKESRSDYSGSGEWWDRVEPSDPIRDIRDSLDRIERKL